MKGFLVKWVLPFVIELLIEGLKSMVGNSSNTVDDQVVTVINDNKAEIMGEILKRV